jgi:hypothetical protein
MLWFELVTAAPVNMHVASGGNPIRINDLGDNAATANQRATLTSAGFEATGQAVNVPSGCHR